MIKGHDRKALFELPQSTIGSFNFKNLEKWLLIVYISAFKELRIISFLVVNMTEKSRLFLGF